MKFCLITVKHGGVVLGNGANQLAAGGKEPDVSSHCCFIAARPRPKGASPGHPSSPLGYGKPIIGCSSQNSCPDTAPAGASPFDGGCCMQEGTAMQPGSVVSVLVCCLQILSKHSRRFPFHQSWEAWIDFQPVIGLLPLWDQN